MKSRERKREREEGRTKGMNDGGSDPIRKGEGKRGMLNFLFTTTT